jgi:hypothetical protein
MIVRNRDLAAADKASMRIHSLLLIVLVSGCKSPNPDFCCTTEQQCAELGASDIRPCKAGQACDTGTCVAKECDTSADCTDAAKPVCINQLCEAKCTADADCTGSPGGAHCASDGVCVGCTDASQCSADKPFCDAQERSCRGCIADSECASGVCVEADARCAAEAEVLYVATNGVDAGTCTKSAPCQTLQFAHSQARVNRTVIHIVSGNLNLSATVNVTFPVVIDGSNTLLNRPAAGAIFKITAPSTTTIEGVRMVAPDLATDIITITGSSLRLYGSSVDTSRITSTNGTINMDTSTSTACEFNTTGGSLTLTSSHLSDSHVLAMNTNATIARNVFADQNSQAFSANGGLIVVENNVFGTVNEFTDMLGANGTMVGSAVRFNTFVNLSPMASSPVALNCDATVAVTSNIFAYHSTDPVEGVGCLARASLFDLQGASDATHGGSISRDVGTFFKNRETGDFHLATNSPAIGLGEPGQVSNDLDGHARPAPTGSMPDVGAFEAP